jgi:hypothetical protein
VTAYGTFSPPVKLLLRAAQVRLVSNVEDAVVVLLEEWPVEAVRGVAHLAALEACCAYLAGNGTAANVRLALMAAAREAGVLMDQRSSQN